MTDLPSDPALLRQTVMALSSRLAALSEECSTLATERDAAIAQRDAATQEKDKLLVILPQYKRAIFGPRSETLSLFVHTVCAAANNDMIEGRLPDGTEGRGKRPAWHNREKLPDHLPRIDVVIDIESRIWPYGRERLHKIGATVKEASHSNAVPSQALRASAVRLLGMPPGCGTGTRGSPGDPRWNDDRSLAGPHRGDEIGTNGRCIASYRCLPPKASRSTGKRWPRELARVAW